MGFAVTSLVPSLVKYYSLFRLRIKTYHPDPFQNQSSLTQQQKMNYYSSCGTTIEVCMTGHNSSKTIGLSRFVGGLSGVLPSFSKFLERIIYNRLLDFLTDLQYSL